MINISYFLSVLILIGTIALYQNDYNPKKVLLVLSNADCDRSNTNIHSIDYVHALHNTSILEYSRITLKM